MVLNRPQEAGSVFTRRTEEVADMRLQCLDFFLKHATSDTLIDVLQKLYQEEMEIRQRQGRSHNLHIPQY